MIRSIMREYLHNFRVTIDEHITEDMENKTVIFVEGHGEMGEDVHAMVDLEDVLSWSAEYMPLTMACWLRQHGYTVKRGTPKKKNTWWVYYALMAFAFAMSAYSVYTRWDAQQVRVLCSILLGLFSLYYIFKALTGRD
jgi:hypothetical protein